MEIVIEPENLAGLRVAEKAGAISEGYLRNRLFHHGESKDAVIFSLVPEDLPDLMPANIEIKARVKDFSSLKKRAESLSDTACAGHSAGGYFL